eukprot:324495-Amphidinium_carterae.2
MLNAEKSVQVRQRCVHVFQKNNRFQAVLWAFAACIEPQQVICTPTTHDCNDVYQNTRSEAPADGEVNVASLVVSPSDCGDSAHPGLRLNMLFKMREPHIWKLVRTPCRLSASSDGTAQPKSKKGMKPAGSLRLAWNVTFVQQDARSH